MQEFKEDVPVKPSKILRDAILACIRITNCNLINMRNRMDRKNNGVDKIILQTEVLSIFKSNIMKVLKTTFDSVTVTRLKSNMGFVVDLDDKLPVISDARVRWYDRGYIPHSYTSIQHVISEAFASITAEEISQQAMSAIADIGLRQNPIEYEVPLSLENITFDSIINTKFIS